MGWTFYNASGQQLKNTGSTALTQLDIDGATDIGAAIVDADLFIVDDGAGGTNRKTAASRISTYIGASGFAQITTGSYTGDGGTATGITGVGFEPKFVMIMYQKTPNPGESRGLVWTWASMTGEQSVLIDNSTYSYSPATYLIISLDADGFTVGDDSGDSHPNKNTQVYRYLAIG